MSVKLKKRMAISIAVGLLISIRWILLDKPLADKPLDMETAIGLVIIAHSCWVLLTIRSFESRAEKGEGGDVNQCPCVDMTMHWLKLVQIGRFIQSTVSPGAF